MSPISWAAATHPGLRRDANEDAHAARPDLGLFLVADGMGGHAAGEVASRAAADTIESFAHDTRARDLNRTWPFPFEPALSIDANRLKAAFRLANRHVADRVAGEQELRGMATTVSAVLLQENGGAIQAAIGHVGDSRVYLYRGGELRQLTDDHSWVGEQIRAGAMSDADARRHPWRNVVTRAISGGADPDIDVVELPLRAGDRLLLCSDGLSGVVTEDRIAAIVAGGATLEATCDALIAEANAAGGPDNITTVLIQIEGAPA